MGKAKDKLLSLSELAKQCQVSRQVIQYYLMVGVLKESARTETGRRRFSPDLAKRVKLIRRLNASGYTLRDIRELFLKNEQ